MRYWRPFRFSGSRHSGRGFRCDLNRVFGMILVHAEANDLREGHSTSCSATSVIVVMTLASRASIELPSQIVKDDVLETILLIQAGTQRANFFDESEMLQRPSHH